VIEKDKEETAMRQNILKQNEPVLVPLTAKEKLQNYKGFYFK